MDDDEIDANPNKKSMSWQLDRFSASLGMLACNLADTGRARKQLVGIATDMTLVIACLWLSYSLRHGRPFSDFSSTWYIFVGLPLLTAALFAGLGIYKWVIRSSNQALYRQLIKGCIGSGLLLLIAFFLIPPDRSNPRSLFVIYSLLLVTGTVGSRTLWKSIFDTGNKGEPVVIYGAGSAGQQLAGILSIGSEYRPVAFIDDNAGLNGTMLSGLPVIVVQDVLSSLKRLEVTSVVLAMPRISTAEHQKKIALFDDTNLRVLTMPSFGELQAEGRKPDDIREVTIQDILGRQEVAPDIDLMSRCVTGKTVLVTGGGGSIGSELCRQIMRLAPNRLIILDNGESNLYHITEEFTALGANDKGKDIPPFKALLVSVTDARRIKRLFESEKIHTVYHAAAYKHVPIVEEQPDQGVDVNVYGTLTVLDEALANQVENFVLISTDKAVRPTNAMGGSKRIAELILQAKAKAQHSTRISMVRFGNVLGSSGSVVPKFRKQIEANGPITLTHTDITRYFMTIPEAAQLVLQASAIAKGGDVFVLDMGEPVRIEDLAIRMVKLYGKKLTRETGNPDDIDIVVQGLRRGEKMYEELFLGNNRRATAVEKISTAQEDCLEWGELEALLAELADAVEEHKLDDVREIVMALAFLRVDREIDRETRQLLLDMASL